jgi:hypothetical protein
MDHRIANPLAYEVSRAFVPPCTEGCLPSGGDSRTSISLRDRNPSRQLKQEAIVVLRPLEEWLRPNSEQRANIVSAYRLHSALGP